MKHDALRDYAKQNLLVDTRVAPDARARARVGRIGGHMGSGSSMLQGLVALPLRHEAMRPAHVSGLHNLVPCPPAWKPGTRYFSALTCRVGPSPRVRHVHPPHSLCSLECTQCPPPRTMFHTLPPLPAPARDPAIPGAPPPVCAPRSEPAGRGLLAQALGKFTGPMCKHSWHNPQPSASDPQLAQPTVGS
eukprot:359426-Chlamydomonas_euryale.AAC.4